MHAPGELPCPGCHANMAMAPLDPQLAGSSYRGCDPHVLGCPRCGGAWVDRRTLEDIVEASSATAAELDPRGVPRRTMAMAESVVYRPCPRCGERMHRRNFGRYSGIVVDDCWSCGSFFEAGKLEGVVAFVRAGGLALARRRDAEEAGRKLAHRRKLELQPSRSVSEVSGNVGVDSRPTLTFLLGFLRWIARGISRRQTRPRAR